MAEKFGAEKLTTLIVLPMSELTEYKTTFVSVPAAIDPLIALSAATTSVVALKLLLLRST